MKTNNPKDQNNILFDRIIYFLHQGTIKQYNTKNVEKKQQIKKEVTVHNQNTSAISKQKQKYLQAQKRKCLFFPSNNWSRTQASWE